MALHMAAEVLGVQMEPGQVDLNLMQQRAAMVDCMAAAAVQEYMVDQLQVMVVEVQYVLYGLEILEHSRQLMFKV
jgi:hypothetical protein